MSKNTLSRSEVINMLNSSESLKNISGIVELFFNNDKALRKRAIHVAKTKGSQKYNETKKELLTYIDSNGLKRKFEEIAEMVEMVENSELSIFSNNIQKMLKDNAKNQIHMISLLKEFQNSKEKQKRGTLYNVICEFLAQNL